MTLISIQEHRDELAERARFCKEMLKHSSIEETPFYWACLEYLENQNQIYWGRVEAAHRKLLKE